jgi:Fe-S-cluster-containing dehydrogenase component
MIIDVAECTNCHLCTLATSDEYVDNEFKGYSAPMPKHGHKWIDILQKERGQGTMIDIAYAPTMCNHCDDAPCVKAARNGAIKKRDDGIVLIDPVKSKGQKQLVESCPYGHIWWNEELQIPQAWNFDAHLLDAGWKQPRGGQICPTNAMHAVKIDDEEMARKAEAEGLERMKPELGTKPRVWYRNMWRYSTAFVGGSLSHVVDGAVECLVDAPVRLLRGDKEMASQLTDNYGDFKFDQLPEASGAYVVEIGVGHSMKRIDVTVDKSVSLGEIRI